MARAKYTMQVPTQDNLGNPLPDLCEEAHRYLNKLGHVDGSSKETGVIGYWQDDAAEPYENFVTIQDETPEMDSAFKAMGLYIAKKANQWGVFAHRVSSSGVQDWTISNPDYREDEPASPLGFQH